MQYLGVYYTPEEQAQLDAVERQIRALEISGVEEGYDPMAEISSPSVVRSAEEGYIKSDPLGYATAYWRQSDPASGTVNAASGTGNFFSSALAALTGGQKPAAPAGAAKAGISGGTIAILAVGGLALVGVLAMNR